MSHFEFFTDSAINDSEPLEIQGVWIHDPDLPDETAVQFRYGRDNRSDDFEVSASEHFFAGRPLPVYDYGEHESDRTSFQVLIEIGPNYQERLNDIKRFVAMRKPLTVRDNRGRMTTGSILQPDGSDRGIGTEVNFTVNRVDTRIGEEFS